MIEPSRLVVALVLLSSGCAYKVALKSTPSAVLIELPGGAVAPTPTTYIARWAPFNSVPIRATARGYRPLEVDLRRTEVRFGRFLLRGFRGRPRGEVELVLVPEHGPVGTWIEQDLP